MFTNFIERAELYTGMYRLTIEYSFMSTNGSFNNRVAQEPSFIELSLGYSPMQQYTTFGGREMIQGMRISLE
jgi:hypothetical protein